METKVEKTYKRIGNRELKIDIFTPNVNEHTQTAIILLHGGGWQHGDKSMMSLFGPELARYGFVAFAPEYRLLGESPWPAQIEDVKSAIRWVRANAAEWNINPDKIAVEGFSAGGHLALMAGGTPHDREYKGNDNTSVSDAVSAVIAFFPPAEFTVAEPLPGNIEAQVLLGDDPNEHQARRISPIHLISKDFPPTFLLHGTADKMVPHVTSMRLYSELERYGVPVEMHLYPGHTHEFVRLPSMMAVTQMEIALFLKRMVVEPEKYYNENMELNQFARM
ncbi:MAG: alpha/beta hydrolase [Deltaproteobacteria bacterium]|nr:alpha/beta hydrolase [Deltaproteobacteria bacterium]